MIVQRPRKAGTIRQKTNHNPLLKNMCIDNVHLSTEVSSLASLRDGIFEKYEKIVSDLKAVIYKLQRENYCLNQDRMRLMQQNFRLTEQLQEKVDRQPFQLAFKKKQNIFEIINRDQQSIKLKHSNYYKQSRRDEDSGNNNNHHPKYQILQQPFYQIDEALKGCHYFESEVSPDISLDSKEEEVLKSMRSVSRKTPCLNNYGTMVQVKSGRDAMMKIFYLFLLQHPEKIESLLEMNEYEEKQLLPHLGENKIWKQIIIKFLADIVSGNLEDETAVLQEIENNPILDLILISILRNSLPFYQEEEEEEEEEEQKLQLEQEPNSVSANFMNRNKRMLLGLCNKLDFYVEEDRIQRAFFVYENQDNQDNQDIEEQEKEDENEEGTEKEKVSIGEGALERQKKLKKAQEGQGEDKNEEEQHLDKFVYGFEDSESESNLLDSKVESQANHKIHEQIVDISLRPNNTLTNFIGTTVVQKYPLQKIYYDSDFSHFRITISIRGQGIQEDDQSCSFARTSQQEEDISPAKFKSESESLQYVQSSYDCNNFINVERTPKPRIPLIDIRSLNSNQRYHTENNSYLMQGNSKNVSQADYEL